MKRLRATVTESGVEVPNRYVLSNSMVVGLKDMVLEVARQFADKPTCVSQAVDWSTH